MTNNYVYKHIFLLFMIQEQVKSYETKQLYSTSDFMRDNNWIIRFKLTPSEYDQMEAAEVRIQNDKLDHLIENDSNLIIKFYLDSGFVFESSGIPIHQSRIKRGSTNSTISITNIELDQLRHQMFDTISSFNRVPESIFEYLPNETRSIALLDLNQVINSTNIWKTYRSKSERKVTHRKRRSTRNVQQCGQTYPEFISLEFPRHGRRYKSPFQTDIRSCVDRSRFLKSNGKVKVQYANMAQALCQFNSYDISSQQYQYYRSQWDSDTPLFCVPDSGRISNINFNYNYQRKSALIRINHCVCL
jgi:hypothetical protein